jgi:hypothetical protein
VTDGDTLTVLQGSSEIKIRLWGIDAPESGDDYSSRAKQHLSELVFGKAVDVVPKDVDRYGRVVAQIIVDGRDAGYSLVRQGLAWHWPKYSGNDAALAAAEARARSNRLSIWSLPNPLPPWEVRALRAGGGEVTRAESPAGEEAVVYHGNTNSKIFHAPWCRYYTCKNCTKVFKSREEAIRAGYRAGKGCKA